MVDYCRVKYDSSLIINGESAKKNKRYVFGFLWDYVWELSELTHFINLFPICQPLSPDQSVANKSIHAKPKEKYYYQSPPALPYSLEG
jgi:hypothetical protein